MGGRGTYAVGTAVEDTYKTVGYIEGVKVLEGVKHEHNLPEESKSSRAYIKLDHRGRFKMMRIYGADHYIALELAFHPERNIGRRGRSILHYHLYDRDFKRSDAIKATKAMKKRYKKFLGEFYYDQWRCKRVY